MPFTSHTTGTSGRGLRRTGRLLAIAAAGLAAAAGLIAAVAAATGPAPCGLPELPAVPPYRAMPPRPPVRAGDWVAVNAFPKLSFVTPTCLTQAPRSNRLYVLEREGVVKCFENDPNTSTAVTVLDIQDHCQGMSDCGLVGMAFHPDFGKPGSPNRGYFYLCYNWTDSPVRAPNLPSVDKVTHDRLSRFTVPDGSLVADPKSELVLIDEVDRNLYHTGGGMFFHPRDGFLYLSLGDEGGGRGILGNCQRIDKNLYGGVIRIDVDMDPARSHPVRRQPKDGTTAHYFIPNDNPFVGTPDALEEFWCLGLRSPHRMTCDPVTGKVWLGDVGDGGGDPREEVNLIEKGGNYQWNYMEGTAPRPEYAPRPAKVIGVEKPPLYEYPHTDGNRCIIGGYVYRGRQHAADLEGQYVFGDFGSGRIWALQEQEGKPPAVRELCLLPVASCQLSSFGVDRDGELYMCEVKTGRIFKLARAGSAAAPLTATQPIPPRLSATGVFADTRALAPAAGMVPYDVNCPLWSDGAAKSRWVSVPHQPGAAIQPRIDFAATGEWTFPAGTVFVKHFELPVDETNPAVRKRLETRLIVRDPDGSVYGVTYKWRPDNSDADLLPGGLSESVTVKTAEPVGELTAAWIAPVPVPGRATPAGDDGYDMFASGGDLHGSGDTCCFAWRQRTGDFDVKVRVEDIGAAPAGTWAGLMARESLEPGGRHVAALVGPQPAQAAPVGAVLCCRAMTGGDAANLPPEGPAAAPRGWVRLKRQGDEWTAYTSADGFGWLPVARRTLALPETVYLGLVGAVPAPCGPPLSFRGLANNREQQWVYPSRQNCLECHNANANFVLGVNTRQLNRPRRYEATGVTDNQLHTWAGLGLFQVPPKEEELAGLKKLVAVNDPHASLEDRVRSYLDANCAYCHRPNGAHALFDARYDTPLEHQGIYEGQVHVDLGRHNARVIAAKDDGRSILYERMKSTEAIKMPPLGRNLRDVEATETVRLWISSLQPPPHQPKPLKHLAELGGAFAGALLLAGLLRRRLRRARHADALPLDPYAAAYLGGGTRAAVNAATTALIGRGVLRLDSTPAALALDRLAVDAPELERRLAEAARADGTPCLRRLWQAGPGACAPLRERLVAAGLLLSAGQGSLAWALPLLLTVGAPALGLVKGLTHLAHGQNEWPLVAASAAAAALALVLFGRRPRLTVQGERRLADLRAGVILPAPHSAVERPRRAAG